MAELIADDLWLCTDCTMLTANGELGQGDADADKAHADAMTAHLGADWHRGLVLGGCTHAADGEDSCGCDRVEFSSRGCDGCGSPLAGYRHVAAVIG